MPEFIDPVFTKTSQNARFHLIENERFGWFSRKQGLQYNFGHCISPNVNLKNDVLPLFTVESVEGGVEGVATSQHPN
jgi:hypothetical protein